MASDFVTVNDDTGAAIPRHIGVLDGLVMPDSSLAAVELVALALGAGAGNAQPVLGGRDLGAGVGALHTTERAEIVQSSLKTPVITALSGYTAGMALGSTIDFGPVARGVGAGVNVVGFTLLDESKQLLSGGGANLVVFGAAPVAAVDRTPYDPGHPDLAKVVGVLANPNWFAFANRAVGVSNSDGQTHYLYGVSTDGHLYGQLVVDGSTPVFVSTADVSVLLTVRRF